MVRRRAVLVLVMAAVVLLVAGPLGQDGEAPASEPRTVNNVDYVEPGKDNQVKMWPYTSRRRSFDEVTLPMNVVVRAEAETVTQALAAGESDDTVLQWNKSAQSWEPGPPDDGRTLNGTDIRWRSSDGANRYTFLLAGNETRWMDATYQMHDGHYFGARYHLRLYEGGSGNGTWTAIQGHYEYWDWFQLSHDVTSLSRARYHIERDFRGSGLVTDLSRERYGNGGAIDADGWVTVIEVKDVVTEGPEKPGPGPARSAIDGITWVLALGLMLGSVGEQSRFEERRSVESVLERIQPTHIALTGVTAGIPLVVRVGAITVERAFPGLSPVIVGGPWFVLLAVGLPVAATAFGRRLPADEAFAAAVLGLGTGIVADYMYLGLATIPFGGVVQRLFLLAGLGLVAAGGNRWRIRPVERHRYRIVGLAVWIGALALPHL